MKKLALISVLVAALFGVLATTIHSEDSDSLDVKVVPLVVAVRIPAEDSLVDFGAMALSVDNDNRTSDESSGLNVFNDGSVAVDLLIQGSNAVTTTGGHSNWTLDCSDPLRGAVGVNQFALRYAPGMEPDWAQVGKSLCSSEGKTLATGIQAGGGQAQFELEMNMPTGTTGYSERTSTVTITAIQIQ